MEELLKNYGFYIERTAKRIKQNMQRRFNSEEFGITVDQWVILDVLTENDGISQYEIAEKTYKDAPTVTRIIDLLCKKNLAQRIINEHDRRRFDVTLTDTGKAKIQEVFPVVMEVRRQGWQDLSKDDYTSLMRILKYIFENFSE